MALKGEDENQPLDLGLSGLLSGTSAPAESVEAIHPPTPTPASPELQPSELQTLAQEERWSELIGKAEGLLGGDDSAEARVWWVRGHLAALSMPASFLAAPLEALCRSLAGSALSPALTHALQETAPLLVKRLEDVSENELAESLRAALERLALLPPGSAERERRIRKKTDAKLKSLAAQGLTLGEDGAIVPIQGAHKGAAHFGEPKPKENLKRSGGGFSNKKRGALRKGLSAAWILGPAVVVGAVVLGVVVLAFTGGAPSWLRRGEIQIASEGFVPATDAAEQVIPVMDSRGRVGSLSALFYSIGSSGGSGASGAGAAAQLQNSGSSPGASVPAAAGAAPGADGAAGSAPAKRELARVNTSGPVEGDEFRKGVERADAGLGIPVERGDGTGAVGPVRPQLPAVNESPNIRHPGPAVDVARPGRAVRSTSVYSGASYGSDIVGRLEPGDKVMIEGNAGRWLRLRSRKGRGGYVRREDVEEAVG